MRDSTMEEIATELTFLAFAEMSPERRHRAILAALRSAEADAYERAAKEAGQSSCAAEAEERIRALATKETP